MQFFIFLALLIAIALVLFAVQNSGIVTVKFLTFSYEASVALILVLVFASGFLSGILLSLPSIFRKSSLIRDQKRRIRRLEESTTKVSSQPPDTNEPDVE